MPLPIAIIFVASYKLERCAWHLLDLALVCARFLVTRKWPCGWSTYDPDVVMKATLCTGMGDLLYVAIIRCERARYLAVRTVWIDWSFSSYLTDPSANLFGRLFDVVANPEASEADPRITAEEPPPGTRVISIPEVYADFGHWSGWRFTLAPRVYFEAPASEWTRNGEHEWDDDPLDVGPTPFHSTLCMPVNRGTLRRLIRDGAHFVRSIRLKQPFLDQFESFRRSALDGRRTVGVHVRAGNGEKGHFVIHSRGRIPIDEVHAAVEAYGARLGGHGQYQVLLMSDTQAYIEAYQELHSSHQCKVITREQWKPPAGAGAFFVAGSAMAGRISDEVCAPPEGGLQLAADAVIDMLCLGHCDVFLATSHSMFCIYPAKLACKAGKTAAQLRRPDWRTEHEGGVSFAALLYEEHYDAAGELRKSK